MQRDRIHAPILGAPLVALLVLGATTDARGENRGDEPARARAAEILIHIDDPARTREWFGFDRDWLGTHFGLKKKHGVQWRHDFRVDERRVRLSIHGPIQRGIGRRHFGLGFQIKF